MSTGMNARHAVRVPSIAIGLAIACFGIVSVATFAAAPLPPERSEFSVTDLEQRNQEQTRQDQEARDLWANWQTRMKADFERMLKLDGSAEIAAEATKRFLEAYAVNNPFSDDDERLRGIALRRRDAALRGDVEVDLDVSELTYERAPNAAYPPTSMRLRETGDVILEVFVGLDGAVISAKVQRSSGFPRLDGAALEAVRAARFKPLRLTRAATRARVTIPFSFKLDS